MIHYRPDIDALRALAVVPVVLFHADLSGMSGGFVGVDVFFVISGFLISSIILEELEAGSFSLPAFYKRRMLRIFPALILVLGFSLAMGWAFYMPDDYKRLCESVFAASTFLSNLYFLKDSGYFGVAPEAKPLLHTWSLAVEEQFYLVFPLYLMVIAHFDRRIQIAITALLWFLGLASSVLVTSIDQAFAFFTLPTRMWELLTGTLLAMGTFTAPRPWMRPKLASWTGLAAIGAAVILYSGDMTFPGLAAIPPVIGSALVIWAGQASPADQPRFMRTRGLVFVGKVSYPLYLWHFPLIALARYISIGPVSAWAMGGAVALSALLSVGSWKLVEMPVRTRGRSCASSVVLIGGSVAMLCTAGLGLFGYLHRGFEARVDPERLTLVRGMIDRWPEARKCMNPSLDLVREGRLCTFGLSNVVPDTLVWGDSFGEALTPAISAAAERAGKRFYMVGRHGCIPQITGPTGNWADSACGEFNRAINEWLARHPDIRNVVFALRWPSATSRKPSANDTGDKRAATSNQLGPGRFSTDLTALLSQLSAAGKSVWVTGPLPVVDYVVPRALYIQSLGLGAGKEVAPQRKDFDAAFAWVDRYFESLFGNVDVRMIRLAHRLCDHSACKVVEDGYPLYFDSNHLSVHGSNRVSAEFDEVFR